MIITSSLYENGKTNMRFCIPRVKGRGSGLGNELFPWAKAYIASVELGIKLLHPAWGLNPRGYYRYFGTSRLDWIYYFLLSKLLPAYTFSKADFEDIGERDFDKAINIFAERLNLHNKEAFVLNLEGMWGGFYGIRKAKYFIMSELYKTNYLTNNLYNISKKIEKNKLVVAVHVRLGDFRPANKNQDYRGLWNVSIPLDWYSNICRSIQEILGRHNIRFILLTDGPEDKLLEFIEEFTPITSLHCHNTAISDLLTMISADILICSISSFSMWAAFLSNSPYFWYKRNLFSDNGCMTIWGNYIGLDSKIICEKLILPRGVPVDDNGIIPLYAVNLIERNLMLRNSDTDLIMFGCIPKGI